MPRLGNKKVRSGCLRCKQRKVKCSEGRPSCNWCREHNLPCQYPASYNVHNKEQLRSQKATLPSSTSSNAPADGALDKPQARHFLELGLLHYYVTTVAPTFPYVDRERGWQVHAEMMPQEGLQTPSLLYAIFSFALLHMHIQKSRHGTLPRNSSFFEEQAFAMSEGTVDTDLFKLHTEYLDRAIQAQRVMVEDVNVRNADGVCLAAVLVAVMAMVHSAQNSVKVYAAPLNWFRLQASFTSCLNAARPILTMTSATYVLIHTTPNIDSHDLNPRTYNIFQELLDWQCPSNPEIVAQHERVAYETSLAYIQTIYKRVAEKEPWESLGRRILAFPSVAPTAFVELLEDGRPRALVMFAHLLAMTKRLDDKWFIFRGVADYHVRGIGGLLQSEWQWAMNWPMEVLHSDCADHCFTLLSSADTGSRLHNIECTCNLCLP